MYHIITDRLSDRLAWRKDQKNATHSRVARHLSGGLAAVPGDGISGALYKSSVRYTVRHSHSVPTGFI